MLTSTRRCATQRFSPASWNFRRSRSAGRPQRPPPICVKKLPAGARSSSPPGSSSSEPGAIMSLRFRLSVLVAAAVAPSLALIGYNSYTWKDFLEADAGNEALASAQLVSAEFAQLLEGSRRLMNTMMKHPAVPGGEEECSTYFKSVIADLD